MDENISDVNAQGADTQPETTTATETGGFSIPDEYKDAGWARNIKSVDDLWKMNANAQSLIGKKTIGIPDDKSTPEEWQGFYSKLRPEKAEDYNLDFKGEDKAFYEKLFYDNGISSKQAGNIISAYKERMEKAANSFLSEEGFATEMKGRFGDNYEDKVLKITNLIKSEAKKEDASVLDAMPNNVLGVMYNILDRIMERYAIKDTDTGKAGKSAPVQQDFDGYLKAMAELERKPHTVSDVIAVKSKFGIPIIK